ncbi:7375_t:CDS:2, partial [Paraglomus occultum]
DMEEVLVNQPKITDINGNVIGNLGTITGGSLVVGSKRDREKDEIDNFFQSPSKRQSSNLFLRKLEIEQDISNETGNE